MRSTIFPSEFFRPVYLVISGANVNRAVRLLSLSDNQNKVVLLDLSVPYLLVQSQTRVELKVDLEFRFVQPGLHRHCVVVEFRRNGKHHHLMTIH